MHYPRVSTFNFNINRNTGLFRRCDKTPSHDDYKEGMTVLQEIIEFRGPGGRPSPYSEGALGLAAIFALSQFAAYGKPEDLERAIYLWKKLVDLSSLTGDLREVATRTLSFLQQWRFRGPNVADFDFQTVHEPFPSTSEPIMRPSFRDLIASLPELDIIEPIPTMTFIKHGGRLQPTEVQCLTDVAEIKDGINYCQQLLASYPGNFLAPVARSALPDLFFRAFECTNEIEYLNNAISGRETI
jgi:hypothetical protein